MVTEKQQQLARYIASQGIWRYSLVIKYMEIHSPMVEDLKSLARSAGLDCGLDHNNIKFEYDTHPYYFARLMEENSIATFGNALYAFSFGRYNAKEKAKWEQMMLALKEKGIQGVSREQHAEWKRDFPRYMAERAVKLNDML